MPLLAAVSAICLAAAVLAFMLNRKPRLAINEALASAQLRTPERMTSYDAVKLTEIVRALKSNPSHPEGTLLDLYIRPVLMWNDIIFAVTLASFAASLWIWVLLDLEPSGLIRRVVMALAASSTLYGLFDVAEDVMLIRILRKPDAISTGDGWVACQLTRLKLVTIVGSVIGAVVFQTLSWLPSAQSEQRSAGQSGPSGR